MKLVSLLFATMVSAFFLMSLSGCGGGGDGGGDGQQTTTSPLNGTFSGDMIITQDGRDSGDTVNLSLTVGSPLSGTFFRQSDGAVGTISGDAVVNSATFTGTSSGDCPASFDGSITLMDNNTISVSMVGADCNGSFISEGLLAKVDCIDISGTYSVEETVTATCTVQGESETITVSGTGTVLIEQNGCSVSYIVPEFDVPRNGEVEGNNVSFTGSFVIPLADGVNLTQNTATIEGTIVDEDEITFMGSGVARGTFEGVNFSCTGNSTGSFTKECDFLSEQNVISVTRQIDGCESAGTFIIRGEAGPTSLIPCDLPELPILKGKINCKYEITGGPRGTFTRECMDKDVALTPSGTPGGPDAIFSIEDAFPGETLTVTEATLTVQNTFHISPTTALSQFGDSCFSGLGQCDQPSAILVFEDLENLTECLVP